MELNGMSNARPHDGAEPGILARWPLIPDRPGDCLSKEKTVSAWCGMQNLPTIRTPWGDEAPVLGGQARLEVENVTAALQRQFTFEIWVSLADWSDRAQVLAEAAGDAGPAWRLELDLHSCLKFSWWDERQRCESVSSAAVVDIMAPGEWVHLAAVFRQSAAESAPASDYNARAHIYLTPEGETCPRIIAGSRQFTEPQMNVKTSKLVIGAAADGSHPWQGAISQAAINKRAKMGNEFPALGQQPPEELTFLEDFSGGNVFFPVQRGANDIVLGSRPWLGNGNHWIFTRVEGKTGEPVRLEILPAFGSAGMLVSMFTSEDRRNWRRVERGHYIPDRHRWHYPSNSAGVQHPCYRFKHKFDRSPTWIAAFVPYTIGDIDELERDIADAGCVEVLRPARTVEGRPVRTFRITDPGLPDARKATFYFQAGQHSPPEQAPGRVIDRLARRLVSNDPQMAKLRHEAVFLLTPIVNIDSAHHGGSGTNMNGVNINRDWEDAEQPEVAGLRDFLDRWIEAGNHIVLAFDFHAGGVWKNHTVVGRIDNEQAADLRPGLRDEQERLIDILENRTGIARKDDMWSGADFTKKPGTFVRSFVTRHGILAVCLEFSQLTCRDLSGRTRPVNQQNLEELGPQFAEVCADLLAAK